MSQLMRARDWTSRDVLMALENCDEPTEPTELLETKDCYDQTKYWDEIATHELTHLPYRSWCCHCVRGGQRRRTIPSRCAARRRRQTRADGDRLREHRVEWERQGEPRAERDR